MKNTMLQKTQNTKSDYIKAELANMSKLYKTRKSALEKMSKAMLEEKKILKEKEK